MQEHAEKLEALRTLNLSSGADSQSVKRAYLDLAKRHHPDVGGDTMRFQHIANAYDLLSGAQRRGERSVAQQYEDLMKKRAQEPRIIRWLWRGPAFRIKMQIKLATMVGLFGLALWDEEARRARLAAR